MGIKKASQIHKEEGLKELIKVLVGASIEFFLFSSKSIEKVPCRLVVLQM